MMKMILTKYSPTRSVEFKRKEDVKYSIAFTAAGLFMTLLGVPSGVMMFVALCTLYVSIDNLDKEIVCG